MKNNPLVILRKVRQLPSRIHKLEEQTEQLSVALREEQIRLQSTESKIEKLEKKIILLECRIRDFDSTKREIKRQEFYDFSSMLSIDEYPLALRKWYFNQTGCRLDLENPQTYNEKIQWFKLYGITPQIIKLVDKITVRDYVAECIGEEYLIPILGVWKYPEEIDFSALPERFVIKANHGSGYNYIVRNKAQVDKKDIIRHANKWLLEDYSFTFGFELQYHNIPRRVLAEQYLENDDDDLYDYKFWCFNGRVEYIQFLSQRKTGLKMDFFDRYWNLQPFTYDHPNSEKKICKPDNLDKMIEKAELLAAGFPHVRVDFYRMNNGRIYFGELTFTSYSGVCHWDPPETDMMLGKLFTYPGMPQRF